MTSLYEPFGLVLVEAMSCGIPVIAFDCPYGPSDIIQNDKNGYLVENGNVEAFAERVCQLIENKNLRLKMGQFGVLSGSKIQSGYDNV